MKRPLILLFLIVGAVVLAGWWFNRHRAPQFTPRPLSPAEIALRDRATIDFSSGKPVVIDDAGEKALIDAAAKEIEAAARNIQFAPLVPPKPELAPEVRAKPGS
ncbi:MAG TPA: hypothetical protein VNR00_08915 [Opitutus sp.]|nr:hypothetical protein [Opitutus sp.]